jgi:hypothetical protein
MLVMRWRYQSLRIIIDRYPACLFVRPSTSRTSFNALKCDQFVLWKSISLTTLHFTHHIDSHLSPADSCLETELRYPPSAVTDSRRHKMLSNPQE